MSFPILTILALLPLVGGAIVLGVKGRSGRATGLVISIVTVKSHIGSIFTKLGVSSRTAAVHALGSD